MFSELQLDLDNEDLNYRHSSNLQGFMMEQLSSEYAQQLHAQGLNPYSQCLILQNGKKIWCIRTLNEEAYEKIILPISKVNEIKIKKETMKIGVTEKRIRTISHAALIEEFYHAPGESIFDLTFQTPTAFKSNGQYVFFPDLNLIYRSLMNKYSMAVDDLDMRDEDALEQLAKCSEIIRYRLKSVPFPMEGISITGFEGMIRVRVKGTDTIKRYARLLMRFGEYSGIGIKTGIGMGAVRFHAENRGDKG